MLWFNNSDELEISLIIKIALVKQLKAIVLAAGKSERLIQTIGRNKLETKIKGVNLICYPISSLSLAGVGEIYIATRKQQADEIATISRSCPYAPHIEIIETWRWWAGNGYTLVDALEVLGPGEYIVSVGDHIYPPMIPKRLLRECRDPFCIAGDSRPIYVDPGEATLILADSEKYVIRIGKKLLEYNFVDTGVHYIRHVLPLGDCLKIPFSFNDWKDCIAKKRIFKVIDVTGIPWVDVDTPQDLHYLLNTDVLREISNYLDP